MSDLVIFVGCLSMSLPSTLNLLIACLSALYVLKLHVYTSCCKSSPIAISLAKLVHSNYRRLSNHFISLCWQRNWWLTYPPPCSHQESQTLPCSLQEKWRQTLPCSHQERQRQTPRCCHKSLCVWLDSWRALPNWPAYTHRCIFMYNVMCVRLFDIWGWNLCLISEGKVVFVFF